MASLLRLALVLLVAAYAVRAETITRAEVIAIARSYAELTWSGSEANVRQGTDKQGISVFTPSVPAPPPELTEYWVVGQPSIGMPYKWGGFDSLASFAKGLTQGRAAGDLYTPEKRRLADSAVSSEAVGVDCSGFISRCWRLPRKYGTATLPSLCTPLRKPADLKPGDILNVTGGHVILFTGWLDERKEWARCYEADPSSKVKTSDYVIANLLAGSFRPWRYKQIRD